MFINVLKNFLNNTNFPSGKEIKDVSLLLGGLLICNFYKLQFNTSQMKMELTLIEYATDTCIK